MKMTFKLKLEREAKAERQRGAALITTLMIATLLLATGGTLILVTSLSARTTLDATAEMQAYYSAEAGMQDTLNVLRGNVAPNAAMPAGSKITFRKAVTPTDSNTPGDSSNIARLSGWLNYNYTSSGNSPDRVGLTPSYTPMNGLAYSTVVSDPDNTPGTAEPNRLLLRVTGYGPKGAVKRLELIVNRSNFNYSAPAMLMMVGTANCDPMTFTIGNSNAKEYSGNDNAGGAAVTAFGATCDANRDAEIAADGKDTVTPVPKAATVPNNGLPEWVRTADDARLFLADQKANAISQNRYFTSYSGDSGSVANPAFTFVDGDCDLGGGAGLIIITGNLTMHGNPSFTGLIIVLGEGHIQRNGGGNGNIYGAIIVAKFGATGGFQPPFFDTNGGGNALLQYDSAAVRNALGLSGPRVMGIHEY